MDRSVQESTKQILWKIAFKQFKLIILFLQRHFLKGCLPQDLAMLLNSSFNVTEILKIVMRDAGIIHYPLFLRKNNASSCTLLKINYCDAGSIYLSLNNDKMYLLSM